MFLKKFSGQRGSIRAVTTVAVAVIVIIIVGASALGAYFVLGGLSTGGHSTTSSQSTSSTTVSSSSSTSSSSTSSSSSSSTSSSASSTSITTTTSTTTTKLDCAVSNSTSAPDNDSLIADETVSLLSNFSSFSLSEYQSNDSSTTLNANYTYTIIGRPIINSSQFYLVNLTFAGETGGVNVQLNVTLFYLSNGTVTLVTLGGANYTGAFANLFNLIYMLPFLLVSQEGSILNSTGVTQSSYVKVNETTVTLGTTMVNQTDYEFTQAYLYSENTCLGGNYTALLEGIGTVRGTHLQLALLTYEAFTMNGFNIIDKIWVTSLTKAT